MRIFLINTFLVSVTLAAPEKHFEIHMPGALPTKNDDYLCSAFSIKNLTRGMSKTKVYMTGFNVDANSSKVGHVGILRCNKASIREGEVYGCLNPDDICGPSSRHTAIIIYDWGKDAEPASLPQDVGFEVDVEEDQIVMQVHYKFPLDFKDNTGAVIKYTDNKPKYNAGMMILLRSRLTIPPGVKNVQADINCKVWLLDCFQLTQILS